jgi:hypothetical protein
MSDNRYLKMEAAGTSEKRRNIPEGSHLSVQKHV